MDGNSTRRNILIIDDEPFILDIFSHCLAENGCDIQNASSGKEALSYLESNEFDLILLDVHLKKDNFEWVFGQLILKTNGKIPIIAITGEPRMIPIGVRIQLKGILEKPFTPNKLTDYIWTTMGWSLDQLTLE